MDELLGELARRRQAAERMGGDERVERHRASGRLPVRERVERLLDRNGGRMRQAAIVRETGWSDAKVSQLLSRMAEAGQVEKLRLGRENLISLPDGEEGATRGTDGNGETGTSGENGETGTDNGESESPSETGSGTV